ncbi:hypothetical protein ABE096_19270 [Robertmurraya massiliosenegalensis]|uniref:hypothetical protein n=1 Tax=Robertmurraya TaxID=2837507 RepID=UPI0039A6A4C3
MKKSLFFNVVAAMILLSLGQTVFGAEITEIEFFGVGAVVTEQENEEFKVEPKGEKAEEGVVYTPSELTSTAVNYKISLKGEGEVFLKIEETDARGTFLNDVQSEPITLTDEWKEYELTTEVKSTESQIDVFVLTRDKQASAFHFKDLLLE